MLPLTKTSHSEVVLIATFSHRPNLHHKVNLVRLLPFPIATAPSTWSSSTIPDMNSKHPTPGLYHITGTDIVRALVFRFKAFFDFPFSMLINFFLQVLHPS